MFRCIYLLVFIIFSHAQESSIGIGSSWVGKVYFQVSRYIDGSPMMPGDEITSSELGLRIDKVSYAQSALAIPQGFVHLSVRRDEQVIFSQPVYKPSQINVYKNGDINIELQSPPNSSEIPAWLWLSIQVKPFDFKDYIEEVTRTWLAASEWAQTNNVEQTDIRSQYAFALYPDSFKEREKLYDLMPSCLHGTMHDPEIATPFPKVMNLSWQLIQDRWMKDHPDFKSHPTGQEVKDAEQLLKDMDYPIFCHQD